MAKADITWQFLVVISLLSTAASVHIDLHSDPSQTIREGESTQIFCESSSPYQWCYYSHEGVEYPTTAKGPTETPYGFSWRKTATSCGIFIQAIHRSQGGRWKCHLANTDAVEIDKIRDEKWFDIDVATPATVQLTHSNPLVASWGQSLEVGCNVAVVGNPAPLVTLVLDSPRGERTVLQTGSNISITYYPDILQDGGVFRCLWEQTKEGDVLYSGEEASGPLEVNVVPAVLANTKNEYDYVRGEELEIVVEFLAKPWPQEEDIVWSLLSANSTRIHLNSSNLDWRVEALLSKEESDTDKIEAGVVDSVDYGADSAAAAGETSAAAGESAESIGEPLEAAGESVSAGGDYRPNVRYELMTRLFLSNLTQNISLVLDISNSAGAGEFYFSVGVPPPPPPPPPPTTITLPPSTDFLDLSNLVSTEVYMNNMTAGSIVGLVAGLLFGLILLLLAMVFCRPRRRSSDNKREEGERPYSEKEMPLIFPATDTTAKHANNGNGGGMLFTANSGNTYNMDNSPLSMSTFGKDGMQANRAHLNRSSGADEGDGRNNLTYPELESMLHSPSSVSTDDLSSLGVRMKEFPDPLASWEDLEPGLNSRRSRNMDSDFHLNLSPPNSTQVRLSGPTGYPVTIPSPRHSPHHTMQKLHLHVPNEREIL